MKHRLSSELFFSFMIVAIVPILLLGLVSMAISQQVGKRQIEKRLEETTTQATNILSDLISDYSSRLDYFCQEPEVISALNAKTSNENLEQLLYRKSYALLANHSSQFQMQVLSVVNKVNISIGEKNGNHLQEGWGLQRVMDSSVGPIIYPNRYISSNNTVICMSIAQAIRDKNSAIVGYAIINIPEKSILSFLLSGMPVEYVLLDEHRYLLIDQIGIGEGFPFLMGEIDHKVPRTATACFYQKFGTKQYLATTAALTQQKFLLLCAVPIDLMRQSNLYLVPITLFIALISILLCLLVSYLLGKNFSTPISKIRETMDKAKKGNLEARTEITRSDEIGDIAIGLDGMIQDLDTLFKENLEKQNSLRQAKLKNLQQQINPHFLYNTLDSVKYLAKLGKTEEVQQVVKRLGLLMRHSINNEDSEESVKEAMSIIIAYLELQQLCYPDKFTYKLDIQDEILSYRIPRLIIQPIVENAIIHGIAPKIDQGNLVVQGYQKDGELVFVIKDDGVGMEEIKRQTIVTNSGKDCDSIALGNIQKRIKLYYGKQYGLEIQSAKEKGTTVTLRIPLRSMHGTGCDS